MHPSKCYIGSILNRIVTELEALKANNGGEKIPHGAISTIAIRMKLKHQWLTKDMIKYRIKKLNNNKCHGTMQVTPNANSTPPTTQGHGGGRTVVTASSSVSTLTAASLSSSCDSRQQSFPTFSLCTGEDNVAIGRPSRADVQAYYVIKTAETRTTRKA